MIFTSTSIAGAFLIDIEPLRDERGLFARTVCREAFAAQGLNGDFVQQSLSWNARQGTLRGLHWQAAPYAEDKLVRVVRGALFDVAVDLRPTSSSFGQWFGAQLDQDNRRAFYIPKGCAHGFQTLVDDTEILYQMTTLYCPDAARGLRWDDPHLAIAWPDPLGAIVGERDRTLPLWPAVLEV